MVTAADGVITETYNLVVTRLPQTFRFTSAATVPATVTALVASGSTANFELAYAPVRGTVLTVVKNTGLGLIVGTFDNLAQGQAVTLSYNGVAYPFVANYYGGSGNDLVLQWAVTRLLAWGDYSNGKLGNGSTNQSQVPTMVDTTGVLSGKTLIATAVGGDHSLALCSDGTLSTWGSNSNGQLGNNSTISSSVPVLVDRSGVLSGKRVVAISAGSSHNLVLCSDGTLAAWGYNGYGHLGNNSTTLSKIPVLVDQSGVLAGKTIAGIAAGSSHNLVLCSDGSLVAWGSNNYGQLGNNSTTLSKVPVLVERAGVLAGRNVIAISAGASHNVVLCADGTLAAWGLNTYAQLGDGGTTSSSVPVLVNRTGVLSGKTITMVSAGSTHSLALCSDGTVAAWGYNSYGQLGDNSWTYNMAKVPVLVDQTGVLAGKTVVAIFAGSMHSLARCSDGTLGAWGYNSGRLGNGSWTDSLAPVVVDTSALRSGESIMTAGANFAHSLAVVASPPPPVATTLAATALKDTGATLNGNVNANGFSTAVSFEFGLTTEYGTSVAATPASLSSATATAVSGTRSGLLSGTTYHYRVVAASGGGTVKGEDMTFTTTTFASLVSLGLSSGTLYPEFTAPTLSYVASVPYSTSSISVTPVCAYATSTIKVNGAAVASGTPSAALNLPVGNTTISTVVTAEGGANTRTYTLIVTRLPQTFTFSSATSVPVTASGLVATGNTVAFGLSFAPPVGTILTVVKNTGAAAIQGTFDNLGQWQRVDLTYNGITYPFVAN